MGKYYSKDIANKIKQFLVDDDWKFSFDEEKGIFKFILAIRGKIKKINYFIDVKHDEFIVYGIPPIGADREDAQMMTNMAEFIVRANYGLKNGCFEMDYDDGEIRYRSFVDCDGQLPSNEVVKNSIYCTAYMFEQYASGILDIIFSGADAKQSVEKCEKVKGDVSSLLERLGEDKDIDSLIARLAVRLGISGNSSDNDSSNDSQEETNVEETNSEEVNAGASEQMKIRTNLFEMEGGADTDVCAD